MGMAPSPNLSLVGMGHPVATAHPIDRRLDLSVCSIGSPFPRNRAKPNETRRNLTKPSNYCHQMCYKNASNSNKSIPVSMVMRMDNVGNVDFYGYAYRS